MNWLSSIFGGGGSGTPAGGTSSGKGSSTAQAYSGFSTNNSTIGLNLSSSEMLPLAVAAGVLIVFGLVAILVARK